jgi:spore coat protein A, manganese oxidase
VSCREFINFATPDVAWHAMHVHLAQSQILNRQAFHPTDYHATWNAAFPVSCPHIDGFCPGYGPPRDYLTPNADGALGGNPAVGPIFMIQRETNPRSFHHIRENPEWKNTVKAFPHQVLRIVVRWTPSYVPVIRNSSYAGRNLYNFDRPKKYYAWYCHLAGHEDNEMMRPYKVSK